VFGIVLNLMTNRLDERLKKIGGKARTFIGNELSIVNLSWTNGTNEYQITLKLLRLLAGGGGGSGDAPSRTKGFAICIEVSGEEESRKISEKGRRYTLYTSSFFFLSIIKDTSREILKRAILYALEILLT